MAEITIEDISEAIEYLDLTFKFLSIVCDGKISSTNKLLTEVIKSIKNQAVEILQMYEEMK